MRCGDQGHVNKAGKPCQQALPEGVEVCAYHDPDPTRALAMQRKGGSTTAARTLPRRIIASLRTVEEVQLAYGMVMEEATTAPKPDYKRLELVLKALTGANAVLQTASVKELNETLMRAEGHGASLVVLEGLKNSRLRQLPQTFRAPVVTPSEAQTG